MLNRFKFLNTLSQTSLLLFQFFRHWFSFRVVFSWRDINIWIQWSKGGLVMSIKQIVTSRAGFFNIMIRLTADLHFFISDSSFEFSATTNWYADAIFSATPPLEVTKHKQRPLMKFNWYISTKGGKKKPRCLVFFFFQFPDFHFVRPDKNVDIENINICFY